MNKYDIKDVDLKIAKKITKSMCEKYKVIPVKAENDYIVVVICEGINEKENITEYLRFIYNKEIIFQEINLRNYEKLKEIIFGIEGQDLEKIIIENAIKKHASDIHFEPKKEYVDIRYRINGSLTLVYKICIDEYITLLSKIKLKGDMDITKKMMPQDGKFIVHYNKKKYDLRISSIPLIYGEKMVIRILTCESFFYKLEDLNFSKDQIKLIRKIMKSNNGLTIVNGPTGAGKSTTLYTILKEINNENINITTLEDPVEVSISGINQMSLNKKLNINFSNGLRSILRQDPDVIMIGEIRDEETAQIAVRASITGHKVYSTIHTNSPKEVYMRLESMGIKPYLIRESLIGIISQRLIKTLCEKCKIKDEKHTLDNITLYKKCGCKECNYCGYGGRHLISSVYYMRDESQNGAKDINCLSNENMKSDLKNLLKEGKVSYEDYIEFIEGEGLSEL